MVAACAAVCVAAAAASAAAAAAAAAADTAAIGATEGMEAALAWLCGLWTIGFQTFTRGGCD